MGSEVGRAGRGGLAGLPPGHGRPGESPQGLQTGSHWTVGPRCPLALLHALGLSLGTCGQLHPAWAGRTPFWHHPVPESRARTGWEWHFPGASGSPGKPRPQGGAPRRAGGMSWPQHVWGSCCGLQHAQGDPSPTLSLPYKEPPLCPSLGEILPARALPLCNPPGLSNSTEALSCVQGVHPGTVAPAVLAGGTGRPELLGGLAVTRVPRLRSLWVKLQPGSCDCGVGLIYVPRWRWAPAALCVCWQLGKSVAWEPSGDGG